MQIDVNDQWLKIKDKFLAAGGILMIVGGIDSGKSTFCLWMCNQLTGEKRTVAIVDCDVGQSDVGPPGCVSFCIIKNYITNISDVKAEGIHFVGSTSPTGHLLQGLVGVVKMTEKALAGGASHVVINTTGWIENESAAFYKQSKIDAIRPSIVAAFEREKELARILKPYKKSIVPEIIYLPVSSAVQSKDREERKKRREENFRRYFDESVLIAVRLDRVGVSGITYPISPEKPLNQVFALIDGKCDCLALGLVQSFDVKIRTLEIKTPFRGNPLDVRRIHFEDFYINGKEKES